MKIALPLSLTPPSMGLRLSTVIDRCRLVSRSEYLISAGIRKNRPNGSIHPDSLTKKFVATRKFTGINLVITHRHFTRSAAYPDDCIKMLTGKGLLRNSWDILPRTPRNSISMNAIMKLTWCSYFAVKEMLNWIWIWYNEKARNTEILENFGLLTIRNWFIRKKRDRIRFPLTATIDLSL